MPCLRTPARAFLDQNVEDWLLNPSCLYPQTALVTSCACSHLHLHLGVRDMVMCSQACVHLATCQQCCLIAPAGFSVWEHPAA